MRAALLLLISGVGLAAGCGDREVAAAHLGRARFHDRGLSTSPLNAVACATCHTVDPAAPAVAHERLDPGYNLAGSVGRPTWWGGQALRLLDAINLCVERFMGGRPLREDEEAARELWAYLDANSPEPSTPALPLTVVRSVTGLLGAPGDAGRGALVWERACRRCHGAPHTGDGRAVARATPVPTASRARFPTQVRAAVEEKIRHGRFFGIGGIMPFYSLEAMTDAQVADLLVFLGL